MSDEIIRKLDELAGSIQALKKGQASLSGRMVGLEEGQGTLLEKLERFEAKTDKNLELIRELQRNLPDDITLLVDTLVPKRAAGH